MESKWWEYYAVRYFVGTVVGAMAVATLVTKAPYKQAFEASEALKNSGFLSFSLIAALGLAFCYIASSPVLVIHATRAHLQLTAPSRHHRTFVIAFGGFLALLVIGLTQLLKAHICLSLGLGLVLATQYALISSALLSKFSLIDSFYRRIASVRAVGGTNSTGEIAEFVTSYRHLREHGNAFMIIVLEILLAVVLHSINTGTQAAVLLAIWILPATISWLIGTVLEIRLTTNRTMP
ncbi:hypothetical protein ACSFA7_05775 [Variovorax sp. LT1R20]|uniref:hypothetical protein n=1 Tax=Variovorax sp. LT1R20 TaxID=3443729 RepID=UPI003F48C038